MIYKTYINTIYIYYIYILHYIFIIIYYISYIIYYISYFIYNILYIIYYLIYCILYIIHYILYIIYYILYNIYYILYIIYIIYIIYHIIYYLYIHIYNIQPTIILPGVLHWGGSHRYNCGILSFIRWNIIPTTMVKPNPLKSVTHSLLVEMQRQGGAGWTATNSNCQTSPGRVFTWLTMWL